MSMEPVNSVEKLFFVHITLRKIYLQASKVLSVHVNSDFFNPLSPLL